jgi:hypothetical protein
LEIELAALFNVRHAPTISPKTAHEMLPFLLLPAQDAVEYELCRLLHREVAFTIRIDKAFGQVSEPRDELPMFSSSRV